MAWHPRLVLQTLINFNRSMDKKPRIRKSMDCNNGSTVEVWEWINNFMPHFMINVIAYPVCDLS